jgi:serine/threonine protein kinase
MWRKATLVSQGSEAVAFMPLALANVHDLDARRLKCSSRRAEAGSTGSTGSTPESPLEACRVPEAPIQVREGEVVGGKYRIGRFLGSGAMGAVFAAHHVLLDQPVAIKFLVTAALGHSDSVLRFLREARATATIRSKHVVRVLDVALLEGGAPYIVMEYLEGRDLAGWLRHHGRPEVPLAVDFVLQACDAIAEAHDLEIIHRDLKPANLFAVERFGLFETIKVLDFGISKAAHMAASTGAPDDWRSGAIITEERVPIGSPCYMSPEQMESARDVDRRTDIWALGVSLCELVTGQLPFDGQSLVQVYSRIKSGIRPRLRDMAPDVPPGLEAVILKCLEPDRERRYSDVPELATALAPFGSSEGQALADKLVRAKNGPEARASDSPRRGADSPRRGADSPRAATPSPRVLDVPRVERTLPSAAPPALVVPKTGRKARMMPVTSIGSLALVAFIAAVLVVRFVPRGHSVGGGPAVPVRPAPAVVATATPAVPNLGTTVVPSATTHATNATAKGAPDLPPQASGQGAPGGGPNGGAIPFPVPAGSSSSSGAPTGVSVSGPVQKSISAPVAVTHIPLGPPSVASSDRREARDAPAVPDSGLMGSDHAGAKAQQLTGSLAPTPWRETASPSASVLAPSPPEKWLPPDVPK